MDIGISWAPASCTLPTAERPLREAEFADLFRDALRRIEAISPTASRFLLDAGCQKRLDDLIARESACCAFFDFGVERSSEDEIALTIRVPERSADVLAGLRADAEAVRDG